MVTRVDRDEMYAVLHELWGNAEWLTVWANGPAKDEALDALDVAARRYLELREQERQEGANDPKVVELRKFIDAEMDELVGGRARGEEDPR